MFGAEPKEKATQEDAAAFEAYSAKDLYQKLFRAGWATALFVGTVLAITPFCMGTLSMRIGKSLASIS